MSGVGVRLHHQAANVGTIQPRDGPCLLGADVCHTRGEVLVSAEAAVAEKDGIGWLVVSLALLAGWRKVRNRGKVSADRRWGWGGGGMGACVLSRNVFKMRDHTAGHRL